jgi:RNA polymerase sigma factor (sigma-70 family)
VCPGSEQGERGRPAEDAAGARKRAAIETYSRHEAALRRTARRYSLCDDDANDALQRGLEILLRKAPTDDPRELIRWTQTVVKNEAHAVRRDRERILGSPAPTADTETADWVALIPADADGPPERAERREAVARSREALQSLKPQELRALALLAEGYSYAEIGEMTGYSQTKINRCLAEGRERFRSLLSRSEDGSRCVEMRPVISAFCDGEAGVEETAALREHLRACPQCRATVRTYRAAPAAAAALMPALPVGRSVLDRVHDAIAGLVGRFSGGGDSAVSQIAVAGGSRGAGTVALAKAIGLCIGTAGGAAACAATGVIPVPFAIEGDREAPRLERQISREAPPEASAEAPVDYEPEPAPSSPQSSAPDLPPPPQPVASAPAAASGAVEYAPPPPAAAPPASAPESGSGDPAGEFGP